VSDRLLDAAAIAELLAVPTSWVREHTRSGAIPPVVLGRHVRYVEADVAAWIESLKTGGGLQFRKHRPQIPTKSYEAGIAAIRAGTYCRERRE
jgi:excisionase family DNA binding protein